MSPPIPRVARVPLANKQPEACPHCGGKNLTRRGTRKKKLEIVQLWRCAACKRTFTPGPAALLNKTYPLRMILSALTDYNLGYTLEETAARRRAAEIGPSTATLVDIILREKTHPEQGFRSCVGILGLAKSYAPERLEAASARALEIGARSYTSVKSILETRRDRRRPEPATDGPAIVHDNIRGPTYFH